MPDNHKFPYRWTLKDANFTKDKGTVFSCFACGGGSTMGYKLAGFDVIGCNEIDPKMAECYKANHNPKYCFIEPIQTFKDRDDLPEELFNLDILDGSPPCSSFSMAGNREKDWGKDKKFREGQAEQVLDTLFFDFIDLAKKLQPKVVIAENVKGLLAGNAKKYVNDILIAFSDAGYFVDYKLLDASTMGVPQRRERVFFYAIRKDLYSGWFEDLFQSRPEVDLEFKELPIFFSAIDSPNPTNKPVGKRLQPNYDFCMKHKIKDFAKYNEEIEGKRANFQWRLVFSDSVADTITAGAKLIKEDATYMNNYELSLIGSYPTDYNVCDVKHDYLIGMSVPPVMTAQIATRIYEQWLSGEGN